MRIDLLETGQEKEWDDFVSLAESATLFHSTAWKRAIEKTFSFQSIYLMAKNNGRVTGILPLFRVPTLPFGRCLVSVPYGVYGGVCAEDPDAREGLLDAAVTRMRSTGAKFLELRHVKGIEGSFLRKDLYATFRRPIFSTEEANMNAIPRKERAEIRKGKKNGLTTRIGGIEYLDGFYEIYAHSVRNLGSPVYPKALFQNLLVEFQDHSRILAVWHREKMVAGVYTFFFRDQVMPYFGGSLKEYFSMSVNDVMYWDLMCHGLEKGYGIFDFGRSKQGTGAYKFKEHWGFPPEPLEYQYCLNDGAQMPNLSPANPKFSLAIGLWKKMPFPLTKIFGPPLTRYLP